MIERDDARGDAARERADLPPEVEGVFQKFRTCEFSTLARDGTPITWPLVTLWRPEEQRFVLTTSIGLPQKAFNIRRDPRVSLLFSDPTASGLDKPPAVLVQGDAEAPDEIKRTLCAVGEDTALQAIAAVRDLRDRLLDIVVGD